MILQKTVCWIFLMSINIPLLFVAMVFSFFYQLFEMPFKIWDNLTEFFSDDS